MTIKILCAIDDQEHSMRAASVAIDLARKLTAELVFYTVNPAVLPGRGPIVYLWSETQLRKIMEKAILRARRSGLWDVSAEAGRAMFVADGIIAFADQVGADYVVVGARGRSGLIDMMSGSVSREVSKRASCPVLIVRRIRGEHSDFSDGGLLEWILGYLKSKLGGNIPSEIRGTRQAWGIVRRVRDFSLNLT